MTELLITPRRFPLWSNGLFLKKNSRIQYRKQLKLCWMLPCVCLSIQESKYVLCWLHQLERFLLNLCNFCTKHLNFVSQNQVDTKELAEALTVATKSMEGIVQNIGNIVPKVSNIQSMCFTLNMNKNKVILNFPTQATHFET